MDEQQRQHLRGRYASARQRYLMIRKPTEFGRMRAEGELNEHLELIGKEAADYYETLMTQMLEMAENMTNPREKADYLSRMPFAADELTLHDVVYEE